jgi:HEPN domain-containing protein
MTATSDRESRRWLDQALEDLVSAQVLLDGERFYLVCFMAHQIAEKALKAYLYSAGEEAVIGHGIERLASQASRHDPEFGHLREQISVLDTYYVPTRYPNSIPDGIPAHAYNRRSAEDAMSLTRRTVEFVAQRLRR